MDKQELERRLESAEKQNLGLLDEIKNLKAKLAEMQDEPEIPDFPKFKETGEEAWHINNVLEVSTPGSTMGEANDYNYFHSKEYSVEFAKKCKLIAMMLHCKWYVDRGYVPDFTNISEGKYFVYYDHGDGYFKYGLDHLFDDGSISFSTEEKVQKCADWLNKHWRDIDDN